MADCRTSASSAACGRQALIVGASGMTGYGLVQNLLSYPSPQHWSRIVGLTNRPLLREAAHLPNDKRLSLFSGLDLTSGNRDVTDFFRKIPRIEQISHIYFAAYSVKGCSDLKDIKELNTQLLSSVLDAIDACCPNVEFITLQTGGKYYGVQFPDQIEFGPPFKESFPRLPDPFASNIFYYSQVDMMHERSKGKTWKWADIRPDAIVGFVPQNNAMGVAQALAVFLSVYRYVYGPGANVPFPGGLESFKATHTDTNQDILARFTISASLNAGQTNGNAYNIGDSDSCVSWESKWNGICAYFGLKGDPPSAEVPFSVSNWMQANRVAWQRWVDEHGLNQGSFEGSSWGFLESLLAYSGFNREYDLGALREFGFMESMDTVKSYTMAFDKYKKAGIIP